LHLIISRANWMTNKVLSLHKVFGTTAPFEPNE